MNGRFKFESSNKINSLVGYPGDVPTTIYNMMFGGECEKIQVRGFMDDLNLWAICGTGKVVFIYKPIMSCPPYYSVERYADILQYVYNKMDLASVNCEWMPMGQDIVLGFYVYWEIVSKTDLERIINFLQQQVSAFRENLEDYDIDAVFI